MFIVVPKRSLTLPSLFIALALSGCLSPANPTNLPPTLSGGPPVWALQDLHYSFIPSVSDPEGDPLTFTITNMPSWAIFDGATGELAGVPLAQHIGLYTGVTISVSDGKDSVALPAFDIQVVQMGAGSISLSWMPPTRSADGSELNDLAGYRIRWGTQTGNHPNLNEVNNAGVAIFVLDGLTPGNYFFTVSAIDTSNNESQASNEASGIVP